MAVTASFVQRKLHDDDDEDYDDDMFDYNLFSIAL